MGKDMLSITKKNKINQNPFLLFSPFLLLYIILVLKFAVNAFVGDEIRHVYLANNIFKGFYSPPSPHENLGIGPGYPMVIAPFLAMHLPYLCIKLLNPLFYYLSTIFLFKSLRQMVSFRKTFLVCLFWSCNYVMFSYMFFMVTEMFTILLVTVLIFCAINAFKPQNIKRTKKYIWLTGIVMGYIALTKVIFGYVILSMLIGSCILWLIKKGTENYRKGLIIAAIAFGTTLPYLVYTYHLTGRVFYWGTLAGNNMYWLTSPSRNEYGTWFPDVAKDTLAQKKNPIIAIKRIFVPGAEDSLRLHHQQDYNETYKYDGVELDDAFKRLAYKNIKSHPIKYLQNCVSNVGRMLFGYPNSYMIQKPGDLVRLPPNGIITVLSLLCLLPTWRNWRKIDYSIRYLLFVALIYLGGSVLGSAEIRMFSIIAPVILLWIAYIVQRSIRVNLDFYKEQKTEI
jgi:hypothetical protein